MTAHNNTNPLEEEVFLSARGSTTLNPGLSAAAQKVGHYEIASDGCSHERAKALVNREAAALLLKILEEEKGTDEALTELARHYCNSEALGNGEASPIASHEETVGMDARRRMRPARSRG